MIEERGANLSGGQRQRIAIARALATNPRILIFDEATSALDYESERMIQTNMRRIVKDRTVIIIAHRLAAVRGCDRIIGIDDGRIVEMGTHDELIRREKGLYRACGHSRPRRPPHDACWSEQGPRPRQSRGAGAPLPRSDHEFLPAALEILETPPSPVRIGLMRIICAFVAVAIVWSYFGRIDIIAIAQGKFQPTGRVKIVQPLETGKVRAPMSRMDVMCSRATCSSNSIRAREPPKSREYVTSVASFRAEALRRRIAIEAARAKRIANPPAIAWTPDIPLAIRLREERVIASDLGQLNAQVASLNAQANQKMAERTRLASTIAAQKQLIATLQERVQMRSSLVEKRPDARRSHQRGRDHAVPTDCAGPAGWTARRGGGEPLRHRARDGEGRRDLHLR